MGALHVVPEFPGIRAPFADPNPRAVIAGLGMASDLERLVGLYPAGVCGLGYGLRQILDAQATRGISIDIVVVSGGAGQDPTVRQILADATGTVIASSRSPEPVLLGTAILAAVAAGRFSSLSEAMQSMSAFGAAHSPNLRDPEWHRRRYAAFKLLQQAAGRRGNLSCRLRDLPSFGFRPDLRPPRLIRASISVPNLRVERLRLAVSCAPELPLGVTKPREADATGLAMSMITLMAAAHTNPDSDLYASCAAVHSESSFIPRESYNGAPVRYGSGVGSKLFRSRERYISHSVGPVDRYV
ncbi:FGGY-family carbohydrate kinase [Rhizobium sp. BT-175]|nr:FGGY-family carbohydrate kinase [Rhizobium sp. BT-175]MCV9945017.1 FGGY-family carbohydrate kinase [Rhizobium sp. BT-175]